MDYIRRQLQARRDANTINKLRTDPSTFLKSHTVNTLWAENPANPNNQSQLAQQFYLVEEQNNQPAMRPGRILGNWRMHRVKNYRLTNDPDMANGFGRLVGNFHAPQLAVRQAQTDLAPNLPGLQASSLDLQQVRRRATIHTMDLSGCTIKREQHALFHVQPQANGATLQQSLGNHTFGPQNYGQQNLFVMLRKKNNGLKYYAQTTDQHGRPQLRKGYL